MEGGKPENPEKNPRRRDENQQQTQPTYDAGSGNRTRDTLVGGERSHHCAIPAPTPVTRPVLHELVRSLRFTNSSGFQRSLNATMFLVAFYGLFRIGELATKSTRVASSVVQFNNLTFLSTHEAKISISNYKHNTSNSPFDIIPAREVSQPFCPVAALLQYCLTSGDRPGPLFCHVDYSPIPVHHQ